MFLDRGVSVTFQPVLLLILYSSKLLSIEGIAGWAPVLVTVVARSRISAYITGI